MKRKATRTNAATPSRPESTIGSHEGEGTSHQLAPRYRDLDELPFHEAVWAMVRRIPRGRATSYGAVAAYLGSPRAARGVGYALAALTADTDVPWWRVVNHAGEVSIKGAPGLPALQRTLLEAEGVAFDPRGRVDFDRYGWRGPENPLS